MSLYFTFIVLEFGFYAPALMLIISPPASPHYDILPEHRHLRQEDQ